MRVLIILPTYNEAQNLRGVVEKIINLKLEADILIIDDNSIDGTRGIASGLVERYKERVFLMERPAKLGLGSAYIEGFKFALHNNYDYVFEMDADFSHDPGEILVFLEAATGADVVIGSRYLDGIRIMNWPLSRLILSCAANLYVRRMSGLALTDVTSGYKCFSRKALEALPINLIKSNGYAFQIEVNFWCRQSGLCLKEIPITFTDRRAGSSKMSREIVREAFFLGLKLLFKRCQMIR